MSTTWKASFFLKQMCAITPHEFTLAGVAHKHSELRMFCDGKEGTELSMYNTNTGEN